MRITLARLGRPQVVTFGNYSCRNGVFVRALPRPESLSRPWLARLRTGAHRVRGKPWRAVAATRVSAGAAYPLLKGERASGLCEPVLFA